MRVRIWTSAVVACFLLSWVAAAPLLAQAELNGAWALVEVSGHGAEGDWEWDPVQPSLYIFMDGYYSIMLVSGSEARPLMPDDANRESITDEQMRSIFMTFIANSGTYEISGDVLATKPMVALWPNFMEGGSDAVTFRIESGMLIFSYENEDEGWWWTAKLERLR
jgi:hypothetical protein